MMDFNFKQNTLDDSYRIELAFEHQAIGNWLLDELGNNPKKVHDFLIEISNCYQKVTTSRWQGKYWLIEIENNEVHVIANHLLEKIPTNDFDLDEQFEEVDALEMEDKRALLEDDSSLDDVNANEAWCGLEDLQSLLKAWLGFI